MLRNQDEDELRDILSQTFSTSNYIDQELKLLIGQNEEPIKKSIESSEHCRSSEGSQTNYWREEPSIGSIPQTQSITQFQPLEKTVEKMMPPSQQSQHIFDTLYQKINNNLKPMTVEQVRQEYPLFLLSQPQYEISNNIKEVSLGYSAGLLRKNVVVMDAAYCEQQKVYKVVVGTDEGQVIIFQPNSSKPQQIIECFSNQCTITCLKWSKNLQYLAVSNDEHDLRVYMFKQSITIQTHVSYRILKLPTEYLTLNGKQLKDIIIQIYFIQQIPLSLLVVDESNKMMKVTMRKNYLHMRPFLQEFKLPVDQFMDLAVLGVIDQNKQKGTFIASSGRQLVTLCLIQPFFEVAMVYDKDKHGGSIKKTGYPHVSFRQRPSSMMVVWDRYLQIVDINLTTFYPPLYSFSISHRFLFADATILAGFLSNSLVYQVTPLGVKIFSSTTFGNELGAKYESKEILFQKINFDQFCHGQRIQQSISTKNMQVVDLRYLKGLFATTNRTLLYCTNKGLQMVYLLTLQQHLMGLVQNNYWKIALQILKNCHRGLIYQLDEIHPELIEGKTKELSLRYINFLDTVVLGDKGHENTMPLWNQELIFIFNIVLQVGLESFLLDQVIPKIYKLNPCHLLNLVPFILTNKLTQLTPSSLQLLLEAIPNEVMSKLVFNLQPNNNDPELPHQINNKLIQHRMYLELIDLNQKFKNHYSSTAVLVGLYLKLQLDNDRNIMQLTQEKRSIGHLMAYSVYDTFSSINFNKYSKRQNKEIMTDLLPLLTDQIFSILIKEQPVALFQNILEELYMGASLQTLNQIELTSQTDLMFKLIKCINYSQVVQFKCQKKYWIAIFKLFARRIIKLDIFKGVHYLCIEDHIDRVSMERFMGKCGDMMVEEWNRMGREELNMFFQELMGSEHICLVKLLGKLLGRHIDVLQGMFRQESQRNINIYDYLQECLPLLSTIQLQLLKTLLKQNIQLLTDIDSNKASDIICKHYLSDLNLFIDDLQQYPNQQLKLIRAVLQLYSYKQSLLILKVRYLQLLAITNQHEAIRSELMKQNYPLDQSLQICKKYDVLEAYAYLLVRSGGSGNVDEAIKVYFSIIWDKIVKTILNPYHTSSEFHSIIMQYVTQCIQICVDLDLQDHQMQWFSIMQQLQSLKRNIFKNLVIDNQTCQIIRNIINRQAYPELIKMLIKEVTYDNVINFLGLRLGQFDIDAISTMIGEMVRNYIYERGMHKILQDGFAEAQNNIRERLFKTQLRGFVTDDKCDFCGEKGGLLVHYWCGHELHPACGQDVRQCLLCKNDVGVIFQKRVDALTKTRTEIYSGGISVSLQEVQHQMSRQDKLKKMAIFQQLSAYDMNTFQC